MSTTTTELTFRQVVPADLETLIEIENLGFTPEEAATPEAFKIRIQQIPDTFIIAEEITTTTSTPTTGANGEVLNGEVVVTTEKRVVGYIDGPVVSKRYITDDLFATVVPNPPLGGHQSILGIAVRPEYRSKGLGSALMKEIIKISKAAQRETITLTCRDFLLPFYLKIGFTNEGLSESNHGGYAWYNMIFELKD